ncbi:hypothetical protein [Idiomarina aquatica]|nr:hypothetical protein [Idiomarina aquatica]
MNQNQAIIIPKLLNDRGVIIDEDIEDHPVSYTKIASWICDHENLLREHDYIGGPLRAWSSGFRGLGCAYGVTDSDEEISNEWIDNYCVITEAIEGSNVTAEDVIKYRLSISFECRCGYTSNVAPEGIPNEHKTKRLTSLKGRCTKCSSSSVPPADLIKSWKRT